MKTFNIKSLRIIIIGALCCSFILAAYFFYQRSPLLEQTDSSTQQPTEMVPIGRLKIPRINVDAAIEYVELTPEGTMGVPRGPDTVGWYSLGTRPGDEGSAVMTGHYGWKNNQPAVFDDLEDLRIGDTISIQNTEGEIISFIVQKLRRYSGDTIAPEVFVSEYGIHLNLVTCVGEWDEVRKSYSDRLVVFADIKPKE